MENRIYKLSDNEFIDLVKSSLNISEVLFKLGYTTVGNSWGYSEVKKRMTDLNLTSKDFRGKAPMLNAIKKVDKTKLFCENSNHARRVLRATIIRENMLPYKCAICGINQWNGKTLSLELDHINGINNDNRLENLRFLCPNCHSQTDTYGARNKKITESTYDISEDLANKIISEFIAIKNKKKVSEKLGISLKAVNQCLKENGISRPNQKYVIQYDEKRNEIRRFGCISECCQYLMDNGFVKTKLLKTCRATLNRHCNILWKGYYFDILDA